MALCTAADDNERSSVSSFERMSYNDWASPPTGEGFTFGSGPGTRTGKKRNSKRKGVSEILVAGHIPPSDQQFGRARLKPRSQASRIDFAISPSDSSSYAARPIIRLTTI